MTIAQVKDAIRQVQDLGVATITFVGGEPLQHPDILSIIESVDKLQSQVLCFTNGFLLKDFAAPLKNAGQTTVIVRADAGEHDKIKGRDGVFMQAVEGIRAAKKQGYLSALRVWYTGTI